MNILVVSLLALSVICVVVRGIGLLNSVPFRILTNTAASLVSVLFALVLIKHECFYRATRQLKTVKMLWEEIFVRKIHVTKKTPAIIDQKSTIAKVSFSKLKSFQFSNFHFSIFNFQFIYFAASKIELISATIASQAATESFFVAAKQPSHFAPPTSVRALM